MLVSDIITEITSEIGGDVLDSTLSTLMLTCMKAGSRRLPVFARDRNFITEGTLSLASGSATAALSGLTGFIRERDVWFTQDEIRVKIYRYPSPDYAQRVMTPGASGVPYYYRIFSQTIQFDKMADQNYTIGLDYFKAISSITSSDTFVMDEQILEAIKDFTKYVYFLDYEEDRTKANDHLSSGVLIANKLEEEYQIEEFGGHVEQLS